MIKHTERGELLSLYMQFRGHITRRTPPRSYFAAYLSAHLGNINSLTGCKRKERLHKIGNVVVAVRSR